MTVDVQGSELTLGPVHLTVADLARSLEYYRTEIGLDVLAEEDGVATLGAGSRSLLVLYGSCPSSLAARR